MGALAGGIGPMGSHSRNQSPTPSNATSVTDAGVDVSTFNDGGTTYFYNPGDELVSMVIEIL